MTLYPLKSVPVDDEGWAKLVAWHQERQRRRAQAKINRQLKARKSAAKSERPKKQRRGQKLTRKQRNAQRRDL